MAEVLGATWISVEERVPDHDNVVAVLLDHGTKVHLARWWRDAWYAQELHVTWAACGCNVEWWTDLPKTPPSQGGENG